MKEAGTNVAPELAAAYADAFAAYLADRGERELGAAYDLGRQAVAAHLSVLDLAEAHHAAVRQALADGGGRAGGRRCRPAADFLRESLSIFESVHRGYREVQEVARIEHEHVEQLRALADASVALNSSLTVEEILQLTADAARTLIGGTPRHGGDLRARPAAAAADGDLAAAAGRGRGRAGPAHRAADRPRARARDARGARRAARASSASATRRSSPSSRSSPRWRSPTPSSTSASGRSPRRCSARCAPAPCPTCPGCRPPCASGRPARASSSAATSTTSSRPAAAPGPR